MPVALETSKRKFHALLDNLTATPPTPSTAAAAAPSASTTTTIDDSSPSTKRVRATLRAIPANSLTGTATVTATTASVSPRGSSAVATRANGGANSGSSKIHATATAIATANTNTNTPNYTPWSHEHFLRRLRTFAQLRLWTPKPDAANEVHWAARGWVCAAEGEAGAGEEGINTVVCRGGCERRVVVCLRPMRRGGNENEDEDEEELGKGEVIEGSEDYSVEVDEELVRRYVELMVTGHGEGCLWRVAGCKDDIYRLPMVRPVIWQPQLRERYHSFSNIGRLPSLETLRGPGEVQRLRKSLKADFFGEESATEKSGITSSIGTEDKENHNVNMTEKPTPALQEFDPVAFSFAIYGWHGSDQGGGNTMATCEACFRRIGLWLYDDKSADATLETADSPQAMKLELVENHRDYCPWVNAKSQSMVGAFAGLAGWEILERVILNSGSQNAEKALPEPPSQDESHEEVNQPMMRAKDAEKSDKVRFARLKELTKAMSFKSMKGKSNKVRSRQ